MRINVSFNGLYEQRDWVCNRNVDEHITAQEQTWNFKSFQEFGTMIQISEDKTIRIYVKFNI